MSWIYADYLRFRTDLVDVYSQEVDKSSPHRWQAFIPHQDLHTLLTKLMDSLERRGPDQQKSLWLYGAYGTGKTFATFVLKHLLEDPLEEVERYLTRHDLTRAMWPRLRALRERGPFLIITRSSTANIDSALKLMVAIQEGVQVGLTAQGYSHGFAGACRDEVLRYLTDPNTTFDWERAFQKYRWQFFPHFDHPQEVINAISQRDTAALLAVAQVLQQERAILLDDPASLKRGLQEIISRNNLQGIVFIWDEFTDFFIHNPTLSGLQELAHATFEMPFYLLLVTHKSPEGVYGDQETMTRLLERFHAIHFRLQPVTAYRLAGNALEVRPERREEWERKKETLWEQVRMMAAHLFDQESHLQDFAALVPMHPYSAFLLSTIAGSFSSSQRTLFRFLKSDSPGGFARFLREYPQGDTWYWLTPDLLWDYFFGEEAGETELTERVRTAVNFCRSRLPQLEDEPEASRLFKGIMLFLALSHEMRGEDPRLRAQRRNLALAFQGSLQEERLIELEQVLKDKEYIHVLGEDQVEYTIPLININQRRLQEIKQNLESSERFEQRIRESEELGRAVRERLQVSEVASKRVVMVVVGAEELRRRRENVQPALKPYQIGIVAVAGLTEGQLQEAERLAAQCARQSERVAYLVLNPPFQERRWEIWKEQLAYQRYCEEIGDQQNAQIYRQRRESDYREWLENLRINRHKLFFAGEPISCHGTEGFKRQIEKLIGQVYSAGPEKISTLGTLYTANYGVGTFKIGLGVNPNITRQFQGLMETLGRFSGNPDSVPALRQLKAEITKFFQDGREKRLADLWLALQEPPYGLFPAPITAVLLGFLTKDICEGHYWSDGTTDFALNRDKMADLLLKVVREQRGHGDIVIRKITPVAEKFCRFVKAVFNLPQSEGNYPEELKRVLRDRIQALGYPLWGLAYLRNKSEYSLYLHLLQCFLKDSEKASQGITLNEAELEAKARQAIKKWVEGQRDTYTFEEILATINLLSESEPVREAVRQTITPENLARGMEEFLAPHHPELAQALAAHNLSAAWVVQNLRALLQEEVWLWEEEVVRSKLPEVYADLLLLAGVNRLCGLADQDLQAALDKCKRDWLSQKTKIPLRFFCPWKEAVGKQEEGEIYQFLEVVMTGQRLSPDERARLGRALEQSYLRVREDLAEQAQVLAHWMNHQGGQSLSVAEAQRILAEFPNRALETDDFKIQQEVLTRWERLRHRQLIQEIKELWQNATGTDSPAAWSRQQRLPIGWVLTGAHWQELARDFERLEELSDHILQKYRDLIRERVGELAALEDIHGARQKFVNMILPKYQAILRDEEKLEQLLVYLIDHVTPEVASWPDRLQDIQEAVRQWLQDQYASIFFPAVQASIRGMDDREAKSILQELAHEPLVGLRLLTRATACHEH
jgi:hypothetical protein